jgi:hypothetical protein
LNNLSKHQDDPFDETAQSLRDDLGDLYRLPVPAIDFDPLAATTAPAPRRLGRWRPGLVAGAAAAGLALFLAGPALFGGSPTEVSAQDVLQRTQEVAATNSPLSSGVGYHMVAKNEMFAPPGAPTKKVAAQDSTTETWYQDAEHQRSETYDAAGRLVFGQSQNGDDMWFYSGTDTLSTSGDGTLRVVRASEGTMGFSTVGPKDFGATSLSSLLDQYSGPCTSAQKVGEEMVAGRPAYVIEITQTPDTCDIKPIVTQDGDMTTVKVESPNGGAPGAGVGIVSVQGDTRAAEDANGLATTTTEFHILDTTTRMWVDQETFITLKMETDSDQGPLASYEVTEFEVNPDFDPSVFDYQPPAGVNVVEAQAPQDIKIVLSGGVPGSSTGGTSIPDGGVTRSTEAGASDR